MCLHVPPVYDNMHVGISESLVLLKKKFCELNGNYSFLTRYFVLNLQFYLTLHAYLIVPNN